MLRRALLIRNPKSRQAAADVESALEVFRTHGLVLTEASAPSPEGLGDVILAHQNQVDCVVLGGGDGTLRCAAAALVKTQLPLGILPMGTANDLARTLEIPTNLSEAAEIIVAGEMRKVDLGCANEVLFFNVAHIGLGARLKANLSGELKAKWGSLSYPRALLRTFAERRPFAAVIESDGQSRKVRSIEIAIGNGRYFGGGATVYHPAEIDDGRLHVFSFAPVSLWRLLKATLPLRHGWVLDPDAVCIVETRQLHIRTHRPMQVAADGELITRTPVEFRVLPQALSVFTPKRNAP